MATAHARERTEFMFVVVLAVIVVSMIATRIQNRHWIREQKRLGTYPPPFTMKDLRILLCILAGLVASGLIITAVIAVFMTAYSIAPGAVIIGVVMYWLGRLLQPRYS